VPESQGAANEKSATVSSQAQEDSDGGKRTAWEALRMTISYGKEYADDMPLVGEPGNFRFSKNKDATGSTGQTKSQTQLSSFTAGTPGSRATSVVPPATSMSSRGGKGGDKAAGDSEGALKAKRRKSKVDGTSP
jgi:hypothetical protein